MKKKIEQEKSKWQSFWAKPWALIVTCYVVILVCVLAVNTFYFVSDKISAANGSMVQMDLTPEDFELIEINAEGNIVYQSISADPQMILAELPTKVRTLRFTAEYSNSPNEIDLYYTTKAGQDFSNTMRVWPIIQEDGSYLFTLPHESIKSLRLDPSSTIAKIEFGEIVLNEPQSALQYFNPGWSGLVLLLILPAFAAAILRWGINVVQYSKNRKRKNLAETSTK